MNLIKAALLRGRINIEKSYGSWPELSLTVPLDLPGGPSLSEVLDAIEEAQGGQ